MYPDYFRALLGGIGEAGKTTHNLKSISELCVDRMTIGLKLWQPQPPTTFARSTLPVGPVGRFKDKQHKRQYEPDAYCRQAHSK